MATKKMEQAWKRGARRALKAAGGAYKVARILGMSDWGVYKWMDSRIPAERVLTIEKLGCGKVRRDQMRPDLYPPEDTKSVA